MNHFDKDGAKFILEVAKNNCGLVLPGCQPVYNPMYGQWLYKKKKMYEDLAKWMPEFHKTGAKLFVQLTAGFGRSFTISEMMETLYTNKALRVLAKPFMDLDKITAAPSPSPNRWSDKVPSREMTVEEIQEFITAFGKTAKLLKDAGVDGVEIHAVHEGYLLDQFTLKYVNQRTDEYGGSFENRYRFAVEIVKEIKKVCGQDFPVSLRYSVESKTKGFREGALPGESFTEAGRDMAESEKAAKYLQDAGYDMLNCDNGTYHGPVHIDHYGRTVPKGAHGSVRLDNPTNLGSQLIKAAATLFDQITDKTLTVRRITITANRVVKEKVSSKLIYSRTQASWKKRRNYRM